MSVLGMRITEPDRECIEALARLIGSSGGRACFVGGCVRDSLLGREPEDVDIEVYGLSIDRLQEILSSRGKVDLVGRQFGVLRLSGLDVDWSLPRADSAGRHPLVTFDPGMSAGEASRRRDLTMNAMLRDVLSGELIDPWGGQRDMENRTLRAPDTRLFVEDPLRFFRVMQFTARFEMQPDEELDRVCRGMMLDGVARERVEEEFAKLLLKAERPSLGLRWLERVGRLDEVLPGTAALRNTPQDPEWHPEGDVWTHTLQVVDAAARLREGERGRDLMLIWAALLHDLGKPVTTVEEQGRLRSPEHYRESVRLARPILTERLGTLRLREGARKLIAEHMKPLQFHQNRSSAKAFKRLALKLSPEADLELLSSLALADGRGTNPQSDEPLTDELEMVDWFRGMARESRVEREPEKPVLLGRHLLDTLSPGPEMGRALKAAYRIQLDEGITDPEELKKRALGETFNG